jgi:Fe-S-cluster containining protein
MELDCMHCGACCAEFDVLLSEREADHFGSDPALSPWLALRPVGSGPPWPFLKRHPVTGRCPALAGPLGDCRCTIYPERPFLCRQFEVGSPECLEARRRHGFGEGAGRRIEAQARRA